MDLSLPRRSIASGPGAARTWLLLALLVEAVLALALVKDPLRVVGAALAAAGFVLTLRRPALVGAIALITLALIPVYAVPKMGPLQLQPAVAAFWLLAVGLGLATIVRDRRAGFAPIDIAVGLFLLATVLSVQLGSVTPTEWAQQTWIWLGPYLGMRLLLVNGLSGDWLPKTFALVALVVVPFVLVEAVTGHNPFFSMSYNPVEAAIWASPQDRLGTQRAEASFGHAIALGMFLATAFLFCIGLAMNRRRPLQRWAWLLLAAVFLGTMMLTVSRTGWMVAAVGVVLLAAGPAEARGRASLIATIGAVIAVTLSLALVLPSAGGDTSLTTLATGRSSELRNSDSYRMALFEKALEQNRLSAFGEGNLTAGIATGSHSIDSAYLAVANRSGVVAMLALLLVPLALCGAGWRCRRLGAAGVVPIVALANFGGLIVVAFITQQEVYIWALVGAAAALDARRRLPRSATAR